MENILTKYIFINGPKFPQLNPLINNPDYIKDWYTTFMNENIWIQTGEGYFITNEKGYNSFLEKTDTKIHSTIVWDGDSLPDDDEKYNTINDLSIERYHNWYSWGFHNGFDQLSLPREPSSEKLSEILQLIDEFTKRKSDAFKLYDYKDKDRPQLKYSLLSDEVLQKTGFIDGRHYKAIFLFVQRFDEFHKYINSAPSFTSFNQFSGVVGNENTGEKEYDSFPVAISIYYRMLMELNIWQYPEDGKIKPTLFNEAKKWLNPTTNKTLGSESFYQTFGTNSGIHAKQSKGLIKLYPKDFKYALELLKLHHGNDYYDLMTKRLS